MIDVGVILTRLFFVNFQVLFEKLIDWINFPNFQSVIPEKHWDFFENNAGTSFPKDIVDKAKQEMDEFSRVLEAEGVTVRRPDAVNFEQRYSTPDFSSTGM